MAEYTASVARQLLDRAAGSTTKPTLSEADMLLLMDVAAVDGVYTSAGLNKAAALAWDWKSNLVTDQYDLGGGNGKYLTRHQWWEQCRATAEMYRNGSKTVDGTPSGMGPRGFGVIAIKGQLAGDT